jgi:hypothetical protein
MNNMDKLTQWRQAEFLAWREWLNSYSWHWFITLTLKDYDCQPKAERLLRNWTRQLSKEEKIQVGYAYIYCERYRQGHVHALMFGRNSSGDKTLDDVSRSKWQRRWPCDAGVRIPESNYNVSRYLAVHLFRFKCSNYPVIEFYNKKLLDRYQKSS